MKNQAKRHLKIVKYDPNDYSLADVLSKSNASLIDEDPSINAAFSLYFQWPDHRKSIIKLSDDPNTWLNCSISYDQDERNPSELRIKVEGDASSGDPLQHKDVTIRFEIFRACYEFKSSVLAISETIHKNRNWDLIVDVPKALSLFKHRRIPRTVVSKDDRKLLGEVKWIDNNNHSLPLSVVDIGVSSLSVQAPTGTKACKGVIEIDGSKFDADLIHRHPDEYVVSINFETGEESGNYFDIYRKIVFPYLVNRYDYGVDTICHIYDKYLKKYSDPSMEIKLEDKIALNHQELKSGFHKTNVDYLARNEDGVIVGASSLGLCFKDEDKEYWAFHQLCVNTEISTFELTENLYNWRADYLASRPNEIDAIFWYDGNSRWLERIYSKFCSITNWEIELKPIKVVKCPTKPSPSLKVKVDAFMVGDVKRYFYNDKNTLSAIEPDRFNMGNVLNHILSLEGNESEDEFNSIATALIKSAGKDENYEVWGTFSSDYEIKGDEVTIPNVSRYTRFPKEALADFRASVEHSIAVSKKKHVA